MDRWVVGVGLVRQGGRIVFFLNPLKDPSVVDQLDWCVRREGSFQKYLKDPSGMDWLIVGVGLKLMKAGNPLGSWGILEDRGVGGEVGGAGE